MNQPDTRKKTCPVCYGTGRSLVKKPIGASRRLYSSPCDQCAGEGQLLADSSLGDTAERSGMRGNPLLFG